MKKSILAILVLALSAAAAMAQKPLQFGWGASLSSSIDITGNEMSNIGIEAYAGLKAPGIQMLGIGTGMYVPINNSQRSIPFYIIGRTSFSAKPKLCFLEARGGLSVNYLDNDGNQTGEYISAGVGIRLASSSKFSSHLILSYTHIGRESYYRDEELIKLHSLQLINMRLGISF